VPGLSEVEREIIRTVLDRFLRFNEPTPRKLLIRKYRSPDLLDRLSNASILRTIDREVFLPLPLAFHYCGDPDALRLARTSVEVVLRVLQNMFDVEMDKTDFSPADVEAHAHKMFGVPSPPETIRLGLYLAQNFGVLAGWSGNAQQTELVSLRIAENIVTLTDAGKVWDEHIARYAAYFENPPQGAASEMVAAFPFTSLQPLELGWPLIHAEIAKVSKSRFKSQHYADAAEAAFKLINERLKGIVKDRIGKEYDGAPLMQRAFSSDKPVLVLGDLSTMIGRDIQVGYQQIFSGAMLAIRNPKAHSNVQIDAVRSMHFIYLASLLMSKIDEAVALDSSSGASAVRSDSG
jgi:uncharacterized protein (TIGR02391 family)